MTFIREQRYIVIKLKDAVNCLTRREWTQLDTVLDKINSYRKWKHKPDFECVVVENDWDCYDEVWDLVKREYNADQTTTEKTST